MSKEVFFTEPACLLVTYNNPNRKPGYVNTALEEYHDKAFGKQVAACLCCSRICKGDPCISTEVLSTGTRDIPTGRRALTRTLIEGVQVVVTISCVSLHREDCRFHS